MASSERRRLAIAPEVDLQSSPVAVDPSNHSGSDANELLQVGDLARSTGKTVRAIHLYEGLGLIEPAKRSKGRYRLFSPVAKVRVRWISKMQSLGLSLTEIQAIVQRRASSESARLAAAQLRDVYSAKLAEVRESIREFQALETELTASVEFLDTCDSECTSDVSPAGCFQCNRHDSSTTTPELVLGARLDASLNRAGVSASRSPNASTPVTQANES
jgi:DNA-binding transcriptional MerR regulator